MLEKEEVVFSSWFHLYLFVYFGPWPTFLFNPVQWITSSSSVVWNVLYKVSDIILLLPPVSYLSANIGVNLRFGVPQSSEPHPPFEESSSIGCLKAVMSLKVQRNRTTLSCSFLIGAIFTKNQTGIPAAPREKNQSDVPQSFALQSHKELNQYNMTLNETAD